MSILTVTEAMTRPTSPYIFRYIPKDTPEGWAVHDVLTGENLALRETESAAIEGCLAALRSDAAKSGAQFHPIPLKR